MRDVVLIDGYRTPFAKAGTALKDVHAAELGRIAVSELLARAGVDPAEIDEVILGNVAQPSEATNVSRVVALMAGINEFFQIPFSTTGWKIARGILGVLFIIAGFWAVIHPHNAFATLAALIGFVFLFKGIFDITVSLATRRAFDLWWIQLVVGVIELGLAFWVAGSFKDSVILLVAYVGILALTRGFTEIFLAFKLKGLKRALA